MGSCSTKRDRRFLCQQIDDDAWVRATRANVIADFRSGYREPVDAFLAGRPQFQSLSSKLHEANHADLERMSAETRHESLHFLVLMLTGACNADCEICFTDRRRRRDELEASERARVLEEAAELGASYVYVPGEGEPTIDPGFFDFLESCRKNEIHAVVFTNGLIFSDPETADRYWGLSPDAAVARMIEYPVSFYHKFWSTSPELVGRMMRIPARSYHYTYVDGVSVPAGLARLMDRLPRERVGVEVVVERRNAYEVVDRMSPFIDDHGLAAIVEMIQHNGRVFGRETFDPTPAQERAVTPLLSPTSCAMATCKAVVTVRGFLSPRIAILEEQLPSPSSNVREGSLYDLLHETDYVVTRRYQLDCLCESLPVEWAGAREKLRVQTKNVSSPLIRSDRGRDVLRVV